MSSPQPINAVQTRVVKDANGISWPQFSADGMTWFPLGSGCRIDSRRMAEICADFVRDSEKLPAQGEVVWQSKKS